MSQFAQDQESQQQRVAIGAFIDVEQRERLVELARQEDRSVSAVVRRALQAELDREHEDAA